MRAAQGRDLAELAAREYERAERIASSPAPLRDPEYVAHINSPRWRLFAEEQKLGAKYRCEGEGCGTCTWELEVHHLDYRRLGRERPEDVLVLCPICHALLDDKRRRGERVDVRIATTGTRRIVTWGRSDSTTLAEGRQEGAR